MKLRFTKDLWKTNSSYDCYKPNVLLCLALAHHCSIVVILETHHTLQVLMEKQEAWFGAQRRAPKQKQIICIMAWEHLEYVCWPYRQHECINSTFRMWNWTPATTTDIFTPPSPPHRFHVPRAYPSFPYPHAKDHQPKFSSPVTTPDSYAKGEGKFFQYRPCVLMEVLHKHTFILVPLLHWHSPRAALAFLTRFLMFDWVQCHSERNAAFGWDRV